MAAWCGANTGTSNMYRSDAAPTRVAFGREINSPQGPAPAGGMPRTLNLNQLAGGQVIQADVNGDGAMDTIILGTPGQPQQPAGLRATAPGRGQVVRTEDLGIQETGRHVVNRNQAAVKFVQDGYELKNIKCPQQKVAIQMRRVPVKKMRKVKYPVTIRTDERKCRQVPWSREVREQKWVLEDQQYQVNVERTVYETKAMPQMVPVTKTQMVPKTYQVPKKIQVSRQVSEIVEEPYTEYVNRRSMKAVPVDIPVFRPECDPNNPLNPTIQQVYPGGNGQPAQPPQQPPSRRRGKTNSRGKRGSRR